MTNALKALLRSRKFLLLVLDTVVSIALAFIAEYCTPETAKMIQLVIVGLQGVFAAAIVGIAVEDAALKRAGNHYCPPPC